MRKKRSWTPIEDDENFEIESNFFLTGLGIDMPSTDMDYPFVFPARHGVDEISPSNYFEPAYDVCVSSLFYYFVLTVHLPGQGSNSNAFPYHLLRGL